MRANKYTMDVSYNVTGQAAEPLRGEYTVTLDKAPDELPRDFFRDLTMERLSIPEAERPTTTVWFAVLIVRINGLPIMDMPNTSHPKGYHG